MIKNLRLYLIVVLVVFGLGFSVFMAAYVVPRVFVSLTKAAPATKVSIGSSYLIGGKILAKADGVDSCVVNVFVLDSRSQGVKNMAVTLSGMVGGDLVASSGEDGKAVFELTSQTEGQYELSTSIGGVPLEKTIKVTFRN